MRAAVVGLGAMGAGMAGNLHRAGHLVCAWNRSPARGQAAAATHGFVLADSLEALAGAAELVVVSVSADADVVEVSARLAAALPPGAIVLDTSTTSAETAREVAAELATRGVHFLDGPVSGGREGAEQGRLAMMVGGEAEVLDRIRPVLAAVTRSVTHMGPVGAGQATKAVNQLMAAGINQAVTEALAFAGSLGLDLDRVIEVLSQGAAGSWFLEHRGRSMVRGQFEPGFRVALHHKDLKICQSMAAEPGVALPLAEATLRDYEQLMAAGHGDEDISALYRSKRALPGNKSPS